MYYNLYNETKQTKKPKKTTIPARDHTTLSQRPNVRKYILLSGEGGKWQGQNVHLSKNELSKVGNQISNLYDANMAFLTLTHY